jgi:hypothetical protein
VTALSIPSALSPPTPPAIDLDVEHVHVLPDQGSIVLSLVTRAGTATFLMPVRVSREIGDGLSSLSAQPNLCEDELPTCPRKS